MRVKNFFYISYLVIINHMAFGQSKSVEYVNLIKKADRFYRTKNYKNSALTYSSAFKKIGWNTPTSDRYNAACAWALANYPDSAFFHLNHIVLIDNYINYEQIYADHDLSSLHNDKRWKILMKNVQYNIQKKEAKVDKPLIKKLDTIYNEDQKYREKLKEIEKTYGLNSMQMKAERRIMHEKDSINRMKIISIIDNRGWLGTDIIGEKGNATLFLVIQHSDIKTQEKYLPIMREAVKKGNAYASDLALLEDRVALAIKKKQIYGSQIIRDSITAAYTIAPIEDEENVDKRRADAGLDLLEDYVKQWNIVYKSKSLNQSADIKQVSNNLNIVTEISDSITGSLNVLRGNRPKWILKYNGNNVEEENSVWFKLSVNNDTLLTFDI